MISKYLHSTEGFSIGFSPPSTQFSFSGSGPSCCLSLYLLFCLLLEIKQWSLLFFSSTWSPTHSLILILHFCQGLTHSKSLYIFSFSKMISDYNAKIIKIFYWCIVDLQYVSVSTVWQSDSVKYIHIFFFIMVYYRIYIYYRSLNYLSILKWEGWVRNLESILALTFRKERDLLKKV